MLIREDFCVRKRDHGIPGSPLHRIGAHGYP